MAAERRKSTNLRRIPAVGGLLDAPAFKSVIRRFGRRLTRDLLREELQACRSDPEADLRPAAIARRLRASAEALLEPRPRRVINATGVVIHTNLGRSLLSDEAANAVAESARSYLDLEYDLSTGKRGSRGSHLGGLLERLFPGQASLAVNNNAAALVLCLAALSKGKQAIVSRGELVEIGGSFRVPDIMAASGARLKEVGTTNRTRLADYRKACGDKTGILLKVHTSNFEVVGFTEEASIEQLAQLARKKEIPLIVDWGSGDLVDLKPLGIEGEKPVAEILAAGADLVTFSGDKLLGGPQAGLIVGKPELIARLSKHPFARVCRLDRLLTAAMHRTLASYLAGTAEREIPTLRMLGLSAAQIGKRAKALADRIEGASVIKGVSKTGGGSSPRGERPTRLVAVDPAEQSVNELERALRAGEPPIVARIADDRLLIDLRTVDPADDEALVHAIERARR